MQNFIVLGIIPGTNYQTTFSFWLGVTVGLIALLSIPRMLRLARRLYRAFMLRQIARTIDRFELVAL